MSLIELKSQIVNRINIVVFLILNSFFFSYAQQISKPIDTNIDVNQTISISTLGSSYSFSGYNSSTIYTAYVTLESTDNLAEFTFNSFSGLTNINGYVDDE